MPPSRLVRHAQARPVSPTIAPHTAAEIANALEQTHWARDLGLATLATFARFLEWREVAAGAPVFRQGDTARFLCTLVSGVVEIRKETSGEEERTLARCTAGRTFGEIALVDHEPRSAGAVAMEHSCILLLTDDRFEDLAREHPRLGTQVAMGLARILSGRLRMTSGRLVDLI